MKSYLEGRILQEDRPVGPLEIARENLEIFADNLIMQDSLRKLIDWLRVLQDIENDDGVTQIEKMQTEEEIKLLEQAWSALADSLLEKGISA